ncbi:MAG: MFS transporter [Pseudomonadota bacterium]
MRALIKDKKIFAWAMYDWANSAYTTTVMAGFFPVFFKNFWAHDLPATDSSFYLGLANSIASLIVVLLAPILGAIADRGSAKKRFLIFFAFMGAVMSGALVMAGRGEWELAVLIYILATLGYSGSVIFYDALIVNVASHERMDKVSALGYAYGYLGGGLLFMVNVLMTLFPSAFGLADAAQAVQVSFVTVALWWAAFTVPLLLWVEEEKRAEKIGIIAATRAGFQQLSATFHELRQLRVVSLFLVGYWLYIDGVDTIVRMAVDYGLSLGFEQNSLIVALLITQFVGFPAAIAFGYLGERIGTKPALYIAISVYIMVCIYGYFLEAVYEFYILAVVIGLVQGGVQSLSRSLYARIIPKNKSAEFFGFFNMLGKFAAVIGPLLMGWVAVLTGSSRLSILSILVLFVLGLFFLSRVNEAEGVQAAKKLESL